MSNEIRDVLSAIVNSVPFGASHSELMKRAQAALATKEASATVPSDAANHILGLAVQWARANWVGNVTRSEPLWEQLRSAVLALAAPAVPEPAGWREALQFYADQEHFNLSGPDAWDTVSGEPQNFYCDEAGTATVENGTVAAMALKGTPLQDDPPETAAQSADAVDAPHTCDGKEQEAFEAWAKGSRFNMSLHPMFYVFLDGKTASARAGWKAGLTYAVERLSQSAAAGEAK